MDILELINIGSDIDINKILMSEIKTELNNYYNENKKDINKQTYELCKESQKKYRKLHYQNNKKIYHENQKKQNIQNKDRYVCEICDYKTYKKQFLQIHMISLKHKNNIPKITIENVEWF